MCMEDIRLGRALQSAYYNKPTVGGVATLIASADPKRTRLTVASSSGANVTVAPGVGNVSTTSGFVISRAVPPLVFDVETYGQLVTQEWYALDGGASVTLAITLQTLEKQ